MRVKGVEEEQDGIVVSSCSIQECEKDSVGNVNKRRNNQIGPPYQKFWAPVACHHQPKADSQWPSTDISTDLKTTPSYQREHKTDLMGQKGDFPFD